MIEVAFIAAASAFSSSGGTARSLLAITHQDGLVLHAAVVIVAPKTAAAGTPRANLVAGGEQEGFRLIFSGPCCVGIPLVAAGQRWANMGRRSSCSPAATRLG